MSGFVIQFPHVLRWRARFAAHRLPHLEFFDDSLSSTPRPGRELLRVFEQYSPCGIATSVPYTVQNTAFTGIARTRGLAFGASIIRRRAKADPCARSRRLDVLLKGQRHVIPGERPTDRQRRAPNLRPRGGCASTS